MKETCLTPVDNSSHKFCSLEITEDGLNGLNSDQDALDTSEVLRCSCLYCAKRADRCPSVLAQLHSVNTYLGAMGAVSTPDFIGSSMVTQSAPASSSDLGSPVAAALSLSGKCSTPPSS